MQDVSLDDNSWGLILQQLKTFICITSVYRFLWARKSETNGSGCTTNPQRLASVKLQMAVAESVGGKKQ